MISAACIRRNSRWSLGQDKYLRLGSARLTRLDYGDLADTSRASRFELTTMAWLLAPLLAVLAVGTRVFALTLTVSTSGGNASSPTLYGVMFEVRIGAAHSGVHFRLTLVGYQQFWLALNQVNRRGRWRLTSPRRRRDSRPITQQQRLPGEQPGPGSLHCSRRHHPEHRHGKSSLYRYHKDA